jgi:exodeoxyribonuclease V alpha subunit
MIATVERTIFHNQDNGFTVLSVSDGKDSFVTTCNLPFVPDKGQKVELEGQWFNDPKYGRQLKATFIRVKDPTTSEGIQAYLASGIISGIGPATAARIVSLFGTETLKVLDSNPHKLLEVKGIGRKTLEKIAASWKEKREGANIVAELCKIGLSVTYAIKVYKFYGEDAVQITKDNPYRLADEVWGIGFKKADDIASELGFVRDNTFRIKSGLLFTLRESQNEGHCYLPYDELIAKATEILGISSDTIMIALAEMINEKSLINNSSNGNDIYLPQVYHSEKYIERRIRELVKRPLKGIDFEPDKSIASDVLTEEQYQAALNSSVHPLTVITGQAGSGKTTTLKVIIQCLEKNNFSYSLCAPTGKAAKRMTEVTERESKTIHRLLEYDPTGKFKRNEDNPLPSSFIIVDESSMIDIFLAVSLLKAIPQKGSLILIGDPNQLPPVGAGNFFRDLIDSGICPVARLSTIMRQKDQSNIIKIANDINSGTVPKISNEKDAFMFHMEDSGKIASKIVHLATKGITEKFGIPFGDIQVISPMKNGDIGTLNLNKLIQETLHDKAKPSLKAFYMDDKVMQITNNYKKGVFNGDIGYVTRIDGEEQKLTVSFESGADNVEYELNELDELTLAYAATVHKFQGSESKCIIVPIHTKHFIMLKRNVLYTAVTRAQDTLIILGTMKAIAIGTKNANEQKRYTGLLKDLKGRQQTHV